MTFVPDRSFDTRSMAHGMQCTTINKLTCMCMHDSQQTARPGAASLAEPVIGPDTSSGLGLAPRDYALRSSELPVTVCSVSIEAERNVVH